MSANSIIVFVSPVAILCAAGIAWFANYQVQHRLHRHLRLVRSSDDLKGRLCDFSIFLERLREAQFPDFVANKYLKTRMLVSAQLLDTDPF